jgi:hypothetical protein
MKKFIELLAKQDFDGAKAYLESITIQIKNSSGKVENYTTLKNKLLANWDKAPFFTTHMYGSTNSRKKQEFTQKYVDGQIRTPNVIRAENKIAQKYGITMATPESNFKI